MTEPSGVPESDPTSLRSDSPPLPPVPAGWYPTPDGTQHYWDGVQWTALPSPGIAVTVSPTAAPTVGKVRNTRRLRLIVAGTVVVLILVAVGIALGIRAATPSTFTARGTFELSDTSDGNACGPPAGYTDLAAGAQVIVSTDGHTVGIGKLSTGVPTQGGLVCLYLFVVKGIPLGHKFYGVEISHRGTVQESAKDMMDGNVALSIGS